MMNALFSIRRLSTFCLLMLPFGLICADLSALQVETREPTEADGKLEWQYAASRSFKMKMDQEIKVSITQGAKTLPGSTTHSVTEMTTQIESVDDEGTASASSTIDRMMVSTKAGNIKLLYDSASDVTPDGLSAEIGKMLSPMVGQSMKQKMARSGRVFDVEVPETMLEGIKNANPMMASMFTKQSIEEMSTKAALDFPSSNPAVGEKWEVVAETVNGPAPATTTNSYEYLGVTEADGQPLHVIKINISMSFPNGISGMPAKITNESTQGFFFFDGVNGMLTRSTVDQDVTMQIGEAAGSMTQNIKQKISMIFTAADKD